MSNQANQNDLSRICQVALCAGAVSLVLLAGCAAPVVGIHAPLAAAPSTTPAITSVLSAEEWVKQRSEARWKLMLQGRFFDAYDYLAPALKKVTSADAFAKGFGPASLWISTETKSVECSSAERCLVTLDVEARVASPSMRNKPTKGQVKEVWIFEDGNWWHYDK